MLVFFVIFGVYLININFTDQSSFYTQVIDCLNVKVCTIHRCMYFI